MKIWLGFTEHYRDYNIYLVLRRENVVNVSLSLVFLSLLGNAMHTLHDQPLDRHVHPISMSLSLPLAIGIVAP